MFLLFKPSGLGFLLLAAGRILTDQTLKRNDSWENNSPSFWLTLASRDNYLCHQIHKKYGGNKIKIIMVRFGERVEIVTGRGPERGFWNAGNFLIWVVVIWVCLLGISLLSCILICVLFCM